MALCIFALLIGQDSTIVTPGTGEGSSVFPAEWADLFDLVDLLLVWALGIVASGSGLRKVLSILADVLPFLRTFVNSLEEKAIIDLEASRSARLKKAGQPNDLQVLRKAAPLVVLLMLTFSAAAQQSGAPAWAVIPDTFPGFYPPEERPGLEIEFINENFQRQRIQDGDTLEFTFMHPDILNLTRRDTTYVIPNFNRFPMFDAVDITLPYMEVRQYSSGVSVEDWYNPDSLLSVSSIGYFRAPIEGVYYAFLLRAPDDGRFIRFYLKTSERSLVVDTVTEKITVIDSIEVPVNVTVYDTIEQKITVIDSVQVPVNVTVYDTLETKITVIDSVQIPVDVPVYVATDVDQALAPITESLDTIEERVRNVGSRVEVGIFAAKGARDSAATGNGLLRGMNEGLQVLSDSVYSYYQELAGQPTSGPSVTLEEVLLQELNTFTAEQLAAKYFKSKTILEGGYQISTCTFAAWAGIGCSFTEATIFTAAKEIAATSP